MYSVSFLLKNSQVAMMFTYKSLKNADDLFTKGKSQLKTDTTIEAEDDFEMKGCVDMTCIAAVSFNQYEKEMKKNGEIQILQTKADLTTQTNAKQDVGLRMLGDQVNRMNDTIPGEHKLKVS